MTPGVSDPNPSNSAWVRVSNLEPRRDLVARPARLVAWGTQPVDALLGGAIATVSELRAPFLAAGAVWLHGCDRWPSRG